MKGIELKKNSAYAAARTVPAAPESSQYDEIVHIAVQDQNNYIGYHKINSIACDDNASFHWNTKYND